MTEQEFRDAVDKQLERISDALEGTNSTVNDIIKELSG